MRTGTTVKRTAGFWLALKRRIAGTDDHWQASLLVRMAFVVVAILVLFGIVIGQASVYQISQEDVLAKRGLRRVTDQYPLSGRRGNILDRSGERLLAVTVPVPSVAFIGAPYYADRTETAFALAEALSLDGEDVLRKILAEERFAMIKRHVSDHERGIIERLALPGVKVIEEERRSYPMGMLFGSAIGYVGKDSIGMSGVELQYEDVLRPSEQSINVYRDHKRRGLYQEGLGEPWLLDGTNLVLTIDARIQMALESELMRRVEEERARGAMAVVLDVRTFDVLAMVSVPSLDPNAFESACGPTGAVDDGSNPCRNKVVQYTYEPGSIGKMLTVAAAYDSGKVKPTDRVDGHMGHCSIGKFQVTDVKKVGVVSVRDAIKYSSNCATKEVALRIGDEVLRDALARFGIGQGTGIDLPGEARGSLRSLNQWNSALLQTAAYGYGYSATLLELAVGAATIANDGLRLTPRVALETRNAAGALVQRFERPQPVRVVSVEAARMAKDALTAVVMDADGTGTRARPEGYSAAGKTGTARVNVAHQGYAMERYITSFVGMAPADDPRVVVAISVIDPRENRYGGTVSGPVFRAVVEKVLPMLGVMPQPEDADAMVARGR